MLCPVALHPDGAPLRLPAVTQADGSQALVHCPENPALPRAQTAANALYHQTGLETRNALFIGRDEGQIEQGALWHFYLCRLALPVRDRWQHLAPDQTLNRLGWLELSQPHSALKGVDPLLCDWIRSTL